MSLVPGKCVGLDKMKIPDSITVNTGDDQEVYRAIERFFLETKSEIEKKVGIREGPSEFRIDLKNMCMPYLKESNESVHMLFYKERVVAAVLETRTEGNYEHFDFFSNISNLS